MKDLEREVELLREKAGLLREISAIGNPLTWDGIPDCCRGCPNHPANGGSGTCLCTLPYMNMTTGGNRGNKVISSDTVTLTDADVQCSYTDCIYSGVQ